MQNIFQEIKSLVNISKVCTTYGINPIKHNVNRFICICPFHDDKSPSLTIYTDTNSFFCYGCGNGGDVITLTEKLFNLSPLQAVNKLNDNFNLNLKTPSKNYNKKIKEIMKKREYDKKIYLSFKEWEDSYISNICSDIRAYNKLLDLSKPKSIDDEISNDYANIINRLQILEYHFSILFDDNIEEKLLLYKGTTRGGYSE